MNDTRRFELTPAAARALAETLVRLATDVEAKAEEGRRDCYGYAATLARAPCGGLIDLRLRVGFQD